jgi:hypothetical protein
MDLSIGSFNFYVGSLGSLCLSDPIHSGLLPGKTAHATTPENYVGSSSKANSPASIKTTEGRRNTVDELDKIMENLDLKESSDYSDIALERNYKNISNYSEEDFTARYSDVSYNTEDEWRSGLELYGDEQKIFSYGSNRGISNKYQVYAIIDNTLEEFDNNNNPIINPQNIRRGAKHMAKGETAETVMARVKIQLTAAEWETIRTSVNNGGVIATEASREVLLGYHYALHRQAQ